MSQSPKPKEDTEIVFSIGFDDDEMPGVTKLLNPSQIRERASLSSGKATPPPTKATSPASKPTPPSMKPTVPQKSPAKTEEHVAVSFSENDPVDHTTIQSFTPPAKTPVAPVTAPVSKALPTSANAQSAKSLSELNVQFELHFEMKNGVYRYHRMKPHLRAGLALWQEKFYFQMALDLKILEIQGKFQEFANGKHLFQSDAFGLGESSHVQIVRLDSEPSKIFVLLSEQSLASSEAQVRELLEHGPAKGSSGEDDFKIELAS